MIAPFSHSLIIPRPHRSRLRALGDSAARSRSGHQKTAPQLCSGLRAHNTLAAAPRMQVVGNASDIFGVGTASTLALAATSFDIAETVLMMMKRVITASLATIPLSCQQQTAAETGAMAAALQRQLQPQLCGATYSTEAASTSRSDPAVARPPATFENSRSSPTRIQQAAMTNYASSCMSSSQEHRTSTPHTSSWEAVRTFVQTGRANSPSERTCADARRCRTHTRGRSAAYVARRAHASPRHVRATHHARAAYR